MFAVIVTLLMGAASAYIVAHFRSEVRLLIVRKMILVYLENHEPMTTTDLSFCLDMSGIRVRKSIVQKSVDRLLDDRFITKSYVTESKNMFVVGETYSLIKQPTNQKSSA